MYDLMKIERNVKKFKTEISDFDVNINRIENLLNYSVWSESPLFWIIFSFNAPNIYGFTLMKGQEFQFSEGVLVFMYLVLLLAIGLPVLLLESLVSQFSRKSSIQLWDCLPLFGKGLAITQCMITFIQTIVHTYFTATTLHILFNLISSIITGHSSHALPWDTYENYTNHVNYIHLNVTNNTIENTCLKCAVLTNLSDNYCLPNSNSEAYLLVDVWRLTNCEKTLSHWNIKSFHWKFATFILAIHLFIFLVTLINVERLVRYVILIITGLCFSMFVALLIIIGCEPNFSTEKYFSSIFKNSLKTANNSHNWFALLSHLVTSLYLAVGFVPHYCRRIDFKYGQTYRNCVLAIILNLLAFIAIRFVLSMAGNYIANTLPETPITPLVNNEIAHPFSLYIIIGHALTLLNNSLNNTLVSLLAMAFLLIVVSIGLISIALLRETTIGYFISDEDQHKRVFKVKIIVTLFLLSSLALATNRGSTFIIILYTYGVVWPVLLSILLQLIALIWLYGLKSLLKDIYFMTDLVIPLLIKLCWTFLTLLLIIAIYLTFIIQYQSWKDITSIVIPLICIITILFIPIPILVVIKLIKAPAYTLKERFKYIMETKREWGPTNPLYRSQWLNNRVQTDTIQLIGMQNNRNDADLHNAS